VKNIDNELLIQYYSKEKLSLAEIGRRFNIDPSSVRRKLKKLNKFNINQYLDPITGKKISYNKKDLTGLKFNKLTVIKESEIQKGANIIWDCICDCGQQTKVKGNKLTSGHTKSCGCIVFTDNFVWSPFGEISRAYYRTMYNNASSRNMKFELKTEELWNLFIEQNRKCALSNRELFFSANYDLDRKSQTASLDRIDSSKEYTINNIQWIHKDLQRMKMDLDQKKFIELCKLVAENN